MEELNRAMRQEAAAMMSEVQGTRLGEVTSYDPETYAVIVKLQPDENLTGWIPIKTLAVGNGWGLYFPPEIGDQAVVQFQEGDLESGICLGFLYNNEDKPLSCQSGEWWMVHKSGVKVLFQDGKIQVRGGLIEIGGINGDVRKLVDERFMELFNNHTHPNTGAPVQKMTAGHMTTNLRGG